MQNNTNTDKDISPEHQQPHDRMTATSGMARRCYNQIREAIAEKRQKDRIKLSPETAMVRSARSTSRATWAIVVISIVTILVSVMQYSIFQGQLSVMRDQLHEAIYERRPWLALSHLSGSGDVISGHDYYIYVSYSNSGSSPAFHIKATFRANVVLKSGKPDFPPGPCTNCGDGQLAVPNVPVGKTPHIAGNNLTSVVVSEIRLGLAAIYLTGRIDYEDPAGKHHKTLICEMFWVDGSFRSCDPPYGNYAN